MSQVIRERTARLLTLLLTSLLLPGSVVADDAQADWQFETVCDGEDRLKVQWNEESVGDEVSMDGVISRCESSSASAGAALRYHLFVGGVLAASGEPEADGGTLAFTAIGPTTVDRLRTTSATAIVSVEFATVEQALNAPPPAEPAPIGSGPVILNGALVNCPPHPQLSGLQYDFDQHTSPLTIASAGTASFQAGPALGCVKGPLYVVELNWTDARDVYSVDATDRCELHHHESHVQSSASRINPSYNSVGAVNLSRQMHVWDPTGLCYLNQHPVAPGNLLLPGTTTKVSSVNNLNTYFSNPSKWMKLWSRSSLIREDSSGSVTKTWSWDSRAVYRGGDYALYTKSGLSCQTVGNCGNTDDLRSRSTSFNQIDFTADYSRSFSVPNLKLNTTVTAHQVGGTSGASQTADPNRLRVYHHSPASIPTWGHWGPIPISDIIVEVEVKGQCPIYYLHWQVNLSVTFEEVASGSGSSYTWTDSTSGLDATIYQRSVQLSGGPITQSEESLWVITNSEIEAFELQRSSQSSQPTVRCETNPPSQASNQFSRVAIDSSQQQYQLYLY